MRPSRSPGSDAVALLIALVIAVAGACFGRLIDHVTHGASGDGIAAANATAPYGLIIGAFAMLRSRPIRAALDAAVFFAAFVVGYYLTLARDDGLAAVDRHYAAVWLLLAVAACPLLTAAVTWARRRAGMLRAVVFALPASAACTEALSGRTWGMADPISPIVIALDALLVFAYLVVLPRGFGTKAAAMVWTAPIIAAMLTVTGSLADSGAYDRWMY